MQVLLCGTNYGSTYVGALWQHPRGLRLGGILSRGGERSRQLARHTSVPYYPALERLPAGAVDAACVAVPGAAGAELAVALLERGVHVLAEHPIAPADLERALDTAAKRRLVFHVNSHFGDLETVSAWTSGCVEARRSTPLLFLTALFNPRTAYSAIDMLGRALGTLEPFEIAAGVEPATADPDTVADTVADTVPAIFAALPAVVGGVPSTLLCQRVVSHADDGSATLVGHQLTAGFAAGTLLLADAFGPVVWSTRPGPNTLQSRPWWTQLGPPASTTHDGSVRERANRLALDRFAAQIDGGEVPAMQRPEHLLGVSRVWRAVNDHLGPPVVGHYPQP